MLVLKSTTAMLNTFRSQAGPQMHDCSLLPCWVFSSRKLVLKCTTALCYHAGYFPVASWSSNPRQPFLILSGCKLVLKSTTAMLSIFPSHAGPQIHDSHAEYFPVASWSSNARLLFATMLGIFRSQAGPQIHDSHTEYFPVASWSSNPRQPC